MALISEEALHAAERRAVLLSTSGHPARPSTVRPHLPAHHRTQKSHSTFNLWKQQGEKDQEPYASFFSVISRARDKHELRLLKIVNDAAEGKLSRHADWKAAAWQLERGWPKKYGAFDRRPLPVEGDEKPKQFDVAFVCNTGGKSLEQLLDFPVRGDLSNLSTPPPEREDEPEMRYNVFTRQFEPIEPIPE